MMINKFALSLMVASVIGLMGMVGPSTQTQITATLREQALSLRQQAIDLAKRALPPQAKETLGEKQQRLAVYRQAHLLLLRARDIISVSRRDSDVPEKVGILSDLGTSYARCGQTKEAEDSFKSALEQGRASPTFGLKDSPLLIPVLRQYAAFLEEVNRQEDARQQQFEAFRIEKIQKAAGILTDSHYLLLQSLLATAAVAICMLLVSYRRELSRIYIRMALSEAVERQAAIEILDTLKSVSFDALMFEDCPDRDLYESRLVKEGGAHSNADTFTSTPLFVLIAYSAQHGEYPFWSDNQDIIHLIRVNGTEKRFEGPDSAGHYWQGWRCKISYAKLREIAGLY